MQLAKSGIDIGIVVDDLDTMLGFYRDTLGLYHEGENAVPGGGRMHRLWAAETMVKLVAPEPAETCESCPPASDEPRP